MTETRAVDSIILNCLVGLSDDSDSIIEDERSRELLTNAVKTVTEPDERERFRASSETVTAELRDTHDTDSDSVDELTSVVHRVRKRLLEEGIEMTISHQFPVELDPHEAARYTFSRSPTVDVDQLTQGDEDDTLAVAVLAAWAAHWRGDDARALDYAERAGVADPDSWTAQQVALVANHKNPDLFRSGKLSASIYLRVTATIPDSWTVSGAYRDEKQSSWEVLGEKPNCLPLPRLRSGSRIRISFRGPVSESVELHSYHVSLGIVDEEYQAPRSTDRVLVSGPTTADVSESVRFHQRE